MALEPIAIVGIGCRFPGANNPAEFWQLLCNGIDAITEVPKSRWNADEFYDRDPSKPGKANTRWGGFLEQIDRFDPQFFGIAPREVNSTDPQQRILLEVAWEALEDGGQKPEQLAGTKTGVFIGIGTHDYSILLWQNPIKDPYVPIGTGNCIAANRISYTFDFQGPSLAVDTACSSSLVAVHLACQSIWNGESSMALAGGVNVLVLPSVVVGFSKGGFLSGDGRCQSFDAKANGYVRSEGAGIVVLKPLSQAQADGDPIYAIIRGSAVNQDGKTNGIAAPSAKAQEIVIREACRQAGVSPGKIEYVEAHGTGTKLGDPIEVEALGAALAENRQPGADCAIGSVKTNIGHAETAAGIAGLIKVALSLKHQQIPPSLHFSEPNPAIAFDRLPIKVQTSLTPWHKRGESALAGVNSFGFGGTNAHVILQQAPSVSEADPSPQAQLFTISAKTKPALQELAERYRKYLQSHPEVNLADLCSTALRRSRFPYRLAVAAASTSQLQERLAAFIAQPQVAAEAAQSPPIAFLFTGQGSQYIGMGRELYDTQPVFRAALDKCAQILEPYLSQPLLDVIYGDPDSTLLDRTAFTQPAIFSLEYALYQLWTSWGIKPAAVMGHSVGEYAAACAAGVFSLEDALKLIAARGRLMQALPENGSMVAVLAPVELVREAIAPHADRVAIAAFNSPTNTVISGDAAAVSSIVAELERKGLKTSKLKVSHAFHSPLIEPMLADFEAVAREIAYAPPQLEIISNGTGEAVDRDIATPEYWRDRIRQPVMFAQSIAALDKKGYRVFVEIGAKPTLTAMAQSCLPGSEYTWLPSLRPPQADNLQMLDSLAQLYARGANLNWHGGGRPLVGLPTYPFQRQRYWAEIDSAAPASVSVHPLLGQKLHLAGKEIRFQGRVSANSPAYLQDHRIEGLTVFPATGYLEIALAAAKSALNCQNVTLAEFAILQPLILSDADRQMQIAIEQETTSLYRFQIFSADSETSAILHATGKLSAGAVSIPQHLPESSLNGAFARNFLGDRPKEISVARYYQELRERGFAYGTSFQGIKELWQGENRAAAKIELPPAIAEVETYQLHPVLLDSCLQAIGAALNHNSESHLYLPVGLAKLQVYASAERSLLAQVEVVPSSTAQQLKADLQLFNESGSLVARLEGILLQYVSRQSWLKQLAQPENIEWLYETIWEPNPRIDSATATADWLIFADNEGKGAKLARALEEKGDRCTLVFNSDSYCQKGGNYHINPSKAQDFSKLIQDIASSQISPHFQVVYLWGLEETAVKSCASTLNLIQALTSIPQLKGLWLITQGVQAINASTPLSVQQAPLWGLARVIRLEYPHLHCRCLDLDPQPETNMTAWLAELRSPDAEDQIAYRQSVRYVSRLVRRSAPAPSGAVQLKISEYGTLDHLILAPATRRPPQAGEVEIQVRAAGLNFRDVLNALGMLKEVLAEMGVSDAAELPFGGECAGKIVAVGAGVEGLKVGDEAIAAQAIGSIGSYVTVNAQFATLKPKHLSFAEAATIPTAFLTAYYGLHYLADIRPGDRVLIHAAAGGVGQAAVQLAQRAGAEVFTTASPPKWDLLKSMGVNYVGNSRTLDFAEEIMALTKGKGVDIILNSLNGDFIPKSLSVLAQGGRFIEIGKIGIWSRERVAEERPDISYFPFDLLDISQDRPSLIARMLKEVMAQFQSPDPALKPLPHQVFPIAESAAAFRHMAQAKHVGKVVISVPEVREVAIAPDASYLITGGLGALGLQVAQWLVEQGARYLNIVGRKQPSAADRAAISKLEAAGAAVKLVSADISQLETVQNLIDNCSPSLKGIIHAAGVLDDGVLAQLSEERFERVMAPKVDGSWNLHLATQKLPLDFFICFSSIASLLGSPGQGNYAAANAFMDALAWERHRLGLPGLSLNWGPWASAGMAAANADRFAAQGLEAIAPELGLQVLDELISQPIAQVGAFLADWSVFCQGVDSPYLEKLKVSEPEAAKSDAADSSETLFDKVRSQIAKVLGFSDPEAIEAQQNFGDLGMDSLMGVELRNSLQAMGVNLPFTAISDYPTVELLVNYLDRELSIEAKAIAPAVPEIPVIPTKPEIKPEFYRFSLMPEYLSLRQEIEGARDLGGNPFFKLYEGVARDTIQMAGRELINYSSYNYLGMCGDPLISEAAAEAIAIYGTSVSASRIVAGERPLHLELEREIADFLQTEDCIVYIGGHATNVSTIGHLFGKNDLIVADAFSHNSIRQGCQLSGATIALFEHNDCQSLDRILSERRHQYEKVLIAIEGIYSSDGDIAPLPEIVALKKQHRAFLLVDEAHSIGVLGKSGRGIGEYFNVAPSDVDLWMGTLSKSFASCGGYIAGCREVVEYLKYTAPGFVFSVGMSPPNTAAALAAIRLLKKEPNRVQQLRDRAQLFLDLARQEGLNTGASHNSPIVPAIVGESDRAVQLSQLMGDRGINVQPMVYPSVPYNAARLRFFLTCTHSEAQIRHTIQTLVGLMKTI